MAGQPIAAGIQWIAALPPTPPIYLLTRPFLISCRLGGKHIVRVSQAFRIFSRNFVILTYLLGPDFWKCVIFEVKMFEIANSKFPGENR